jgi:hypothetical protein
MMNINQNEVRSGSRIVLVDGWGADVAWKRVEHFKKRLQNILEDLGYKARIYTSGSGIVTGSAFPNGDFSYEPEAVSYIKEEVPFRREPVLIDDVGNTYGEYPVLKIAVRDGGGANKTINNIIREILKIYNISENEAGRHYGSPVESGTIVYALRRDTDEDSHDEEFRHIDDLLGSLSNKVL